MKILLGTIGEWQAVLTMLLDSSQIEVVVLNFSGIRKVSCSGGDLVISTAPILKSLLYRDTLLFTKEERFFYVLTILNRIKGLYQLFCFSLQTLMLFTFELSHWIENGEMV